MQVLRSIIEEFVQFVFPKYTQIYRNTKVIKRAVEADVYRHNKIVSIFSRNSI